jgi:hypothetical protein
MFIPGRKTKQSRRTRRFPVAIHPPNRKSSPPDGYGSSLWCNKLWGVGGRRLGNPFHQNLCGREAPKLRPLAGLVSIPCVANHKRQDPDFLIGPSNKKKRKKSRPLKFFIHHSKLQGLNSVHRCRCVPPPPPTTTLPFSPRQLIRICRIVPASPKFWYISYPFDRSDFECQSALKMHDQST